MELSGQSKTHCWVEKASQHAHAEAAHAFLYTARGSARAGSTKGNRTHRALAQVGASGCPMCGGHK